jgi:hypothetical protein
MTIPLNKYKMEIYGGEATRYELLIQRNFKENINS